MKKKLLALLLSAALLAGSVPAHAAGSAFPAVNTYPGFSDVRESDWFYSSAKLCYEIGLMNGTDKGFEPNKTLTGPECAALAARLLQGLTGRPIPEASAFPGKPWYQNYMEYLGDFVQESKSSLYGLIKWYDLEEFEKPATRYDFLVFMALVADGNGDYFPALNSLTYDDIPDVADDSVVLQFYNIGILTGKDQYGTFDGDGTLTRAEAAAMVTRMARSDQRLTFTPAPAPSQSPAGDMAAFVKSYLNGKSEATYFLYGGKAATAGDFLTAALTAADELNALCVQEGVAFAWDNTLDMGGQGQTYFITYVYTWANTTAIDSAPAADPKTAYAAWQAQTYKAKHILITEESGGKETADILYDVLKNDPAQFDPLLILYGEDPGMEQNPDGYLFGPGDMVSEFEAGTKALQVGQISQPIQSQFGWHIIQRLPLTQADYESDSDRLLFSADFPDGIDVTAAYAAWLAYNP